MPNDPVTGAIDYVRLIINAIAAGRAEARELKDLTDEGLEAKIKQLQDDAQAEIDRGKALDQQ